MKRLTYTKPHTLPKLHGELLAVGITPIAVEGKGDDIWLTVEDAVRNADVGDVVSAHVKDVNWDSRELTQRKSDIATVLNSVGFKGLGLGPYRAAMARMLGAKPPTVPETQDVTSSDVRLLSE